MIIKVCGMRDPENIRAVSALDIDWMGFVFWRDSPRYLQQISSRTGTLPDYSSLRDDAMREERYFARRCVCGRHAAEHRDACG